MRLAWGRSKQKTFRQLKSSLFLFCTVLFQNLFYSIQNSFVSPLKRKISIYFFIQSVNGKVEVEFGFLAVISIESIRSLALLWLCTYGNMYTCHSTDWLTDWLRRILQIKLAKVWIQLNFLPNLCRGIRHSSLIDSNERNVFTFSLVGGVEHSNIEMIRNKS